MKVSTLFKYILAVGLLLVFACSPVCCVYACQSLPKSVFGPEFKLETPLTISSPIMFAFGVLMIFQLVVSINFFSAAYDEHAGRK